MTVPGYIAISDAELASGKPLTSSLMTQLRDNPFAILAVDPAAIVVPTAVFTEFAIAGGPYTYTCSRKCMLEISGVGAGGGGAQDGQSSGSSGAAVLGLKFPLVAGDYVTITIGTGGTAGGATGGDGSDSLIEITRSVGTVRLLKAKLGGGKGGNGGTHQAAGVPSIWRDDKNNASAYDSTSVPPCFLPGVAGVDAANTSPTSQSGAPSPFFSGNRSKAGERGAGGASGNDLAAGYAGGDGYVCITDYGRA